MNLQRNDNIFGLVVSALILIPLLVGFRAFLVMIALGALLQSYGLDGPSFWVSLLVALVLFPARAGTSSNA